MKNEEVTKLIKDLKEFCKNQKCARCCLADDEDGHCIITDDAPSKLDIKIFEKQAKELL